jgi:preprotein translocase subunit SecD
VDSVIERLSGTKEKDMMKLQESKFSRHVEDNELRLLMQNEQEDIRNDELNQIAEIVIQRIQDKLRGLEFHNPNKPTENQQGIALNKPNASH